MKGKFHDIKYSKNETKNKHIYIALIKNATMHLKIRRFSSIELKIHKTPTKNSTNNYKTTIL